MLQGLVAGMNAARRAQGIEPVTLPRNSSYIGTLVDDLVTKVQCLAAENILTVMSCCVFSCQRWY